MNRLVSATLAAGALLAFAAAPTLASHTHVMRVGGGQCVILAAAGGEEDVVLPLAVFERNPNVDIAPTLDRMHPLHVLVHKGVPGDHNRLEVYGTTAGNNLCASGYLNQ